MGEIQVITGPMFSGKTTELLRRLERHVLAGKEFTAYKPAVDTRDQSTTIKTIRGEISLKPIAVESLASAKPTTEVVVLDEAQFFGLEIIRFCQTQRSLGRIIIIAGLDMDYLRHPFGYMGDVMAIADSVTKLKAVCACGKDAVFTKKLVPDGKRIDIGDSKYIPVCSDCYNRIENPICPRCQNEEFSPGAKYCRICGYFIVGR
jgi:thymidine kinase